MSSKLLTFEVDVFGATIHLCPELSEKQVSKQIKESTGLEYMPDFGAESANTIVCENSNDGRFAIFIWLSENATNGSLVHESVHAANAILNSRGIVADFNNDETQAYLTEFIFKKSLGLLSGS